MAKDKDRKARCMISLSQNGLDFLWAYTNRKNIKDTSESWGEWLIDHIQKKVEEEIKEGVEVSDEEKYLAVVRQTKKRIRIQEELNMIATNWDDQEKEKYYPLAEKIGLDTVEAQDKSDQLKKSGAQLVFDKGDAPQTKQEECNKLVMSLYSSQPMIPRVIIEKIVKEKGFADFNLKRSKIDLGLISVKNSDKVLCWSLTSIALSSIVAKKPNEEQD